LDYCSLKRGAVSNCLGLNGIWFKKERSSL
jgi:hypothetical protein